MKEKKKKGKKVMVILWFIKIDHVTAQWCAELSAGEDVASPL